MRFNQPWNKCNINKATVNNFRIKLFQYYADAAQYVCSSSVPLCRCIHHSSLFSSLFLSSSLLLSLTCCPIRIDRRRAASRRRLCGLARISKSIFSDSLSLLFLSYFFRYMARVGGVGSIAAI